MEVKQNNIAEEKEFALLTLANKIYINKKFILKTLSIGLVIGLIIAFSIPKEYTTKIVLVQEAQSIPDGTIGSLAVLAGMNIGGGGNGINALASPDLYPNVIESTSFVKGLFDIDVKDSKEGIDTTLYSYMDNYQKSAWWSYIFKAPSILISLLSSNDSSSKKEAMNKRIISKDEMRIIEALRSRMVISSERRTAITTIEVTMQSPEISAYLVDTLTSYFQSYIIDYRTQKIREDLIFAEKLYEEAKANYYTSQQKLAVFIDGNINVVSARYRLAQERLQNETALAYSVYNQTAQQLQLTKVKVQDNTPVFTVIQPAVEPMIPSAPSKKLVLAGVLFFTFILSVFWVLRADLKSLIIEN